MAAHKQDEWIPATTPPVCFGKYKVKVTDLYRPGIQSVRTAIYSRMFSQTGFWDISTSAEGIRSFSLLNVVSWHRNRVIDRIPLDPVTKKTGLLCQVCRKVEATTTRKDALGRTQHVCSSCACRKSPRHLERREKSE